ncbi:MAG: class I tRNA ligase family protein, partial [SAR324 cluster bacterium]|nr:class I tRNA ligase family protein [SAR324 cluster bacterium]
LKVAEPFTNLLTQGMVCKETQECPEHGLLYPHEVKDNLCIHCQSDVIIGNTVKMSKSIKNVVDPEELINHYGADTVRMFCLFTSPPERDLEWSEQGVEGSFRFLNRVWRLVGDHLKEFSGFSTYEGKEPLSGHLKNLHQKTHQTIKKVTDDIEDRFHFNTAISAVMELINEVNRFLKSDQDKAPLAWSLVKEAVEATVVLLFPVVPHITEELWSMLGHDETLINIPWPTYRVEALEVEKRLIVLQVNSKVRSRVEVPASYNQREIEAEALKNERVQQFVGEKPIKKVIVVKNKLVNIVV